MFIYIAKEQKKLQTIFFGVLNISNGPTYIEFHET